jgi:hypothetical protein
MKRFLAIYIGTEDAQRRAKWNELGEQQRQTLIDSGMKAWMDWGMKHSTAIVDHGNPLGPTKRASGNGITDIKNAMTGYVIVEAESHEAAAALFRNHPHFSIFPGDSVEIMECLPVPSR